MEKCVDLDVDFGEILNSKHEKEISIFEIDSTHIYALIATVLTAFMFVSLFSPRVFIIIFT